MVSFLAGLSDVLAERPEDALPPPRLDVVDAARLYQTLYWVARTAAIETPPCDALLVTAAAGPRFRRSFTVPSTDTARAERARHLRPRGLPRRGAATADRLVALRGHTAGPRPRTRRVRVLRRRLPRHRRERALGAGSRGRAPAHPRHLQRRQGHGAAHPGARSRDRRLGRAHRPVEDIHRRSRAREVLERFPDARFLHYGR